MAQAPMTRRRRRVWLARLMGAINVPMRLMLRLLFQTPLSAGPAAGLARGEAKTISGGGSLRRA